VVQFTKKIQQDATAYQNFVSYLYEAQHVSGVIPPIIRSLKLHWQPLVLYTWRVDGRVIAGRWQLPATTHVCKARGCNYSFGAPDDERCGARNML